MTSFRRFRGSELAEYYSYDAQELTNLAKAVNSGVYLRAELGTIGLYLGAYKGRPLWMYVPLGQEANTDYLQVHDGVNSVSAADFHPDQPAPILSASSSTSSAMTILTGEQDEDKVEEAGDETAKPTELPQMSPYGSHGWLTLGSWWAATTGIAAVACPSITLGFHVQASHTSMLNGLSTICEASFGFFEWLKPSDLALISMISRASYMPVRDVLAIRSVTQRDVLVWLLAHPSRGESSEIVAREARHALRRQQTCACLARGHSVKGRRPFCRCPEHADWKQAVRVTGPSTPSTGPSTPAGSRCVPEAVSAPPRIQQGRGEVASPSTPSTSPRTPAVSRCLPEAASAPLRTQQGHGGQRPGSMTADQLIQRVLEDSEEKRRLKRQVGQLEADNDFLRDENRRLEATTSNCTKPFLDSNLDNLNDFEVMMTKYGWENGAFLVHGKHPGIRRLAIETKIREVSLRQLASGGSNRRYNNLRKAAGFPLIHLRNVQKAKKGLGFKVGELSESAIQQYFCEMVLDFIAGGESFFFVDPPVGQVGGRDRRLGTAGNGGLTGESLIDSSTASAADNGTWYRC